MLQESCFIEVSPPLNSLLLTTAGYLVYALSDVLFYITPIPSSKWVTPTFLWPYTIGSQILLPPMFGVIFANMLLNLIHRQNLDTLLCYPAVKTGSFVMTQYRRVTDGRTDRNSIANTARSTAARCKMYQQSMICISSYQDRSYVLLHRVHQAIHWLQVWLYYYLSTHRPSYVKHDVIMSTKVQSYIGSVLSRCVNRDLVHYSSATAVHCVDVKQFRFGNFLSDKPSTMPGATAFQGG